MWCIGIVAHCSPVWIIPPLPLKSADFRGSGGIIQTGEQCATIPMHHIMQLVDIPLGNLKQAPSLLW